MTSSDLEQKAARLRREALDILEGGVMGLLEAQFGKIHIAGSVALDLMTWPDIDLYWRLDQSQKHDFISLIPRLQTRLEARGLFLFRCVFNDEILLSRKSPHDGFYWGLHCIQGETKWKIDLWGWAESNYAERHNDHVELAERLRSADRKLILELKNALHHHPEYRKTVYSVDIYSFALEQAGSTLQEFWRWLEARREKQSL